MLAAWGPFLFAEAYSLSGIVTVLFTGIASRRYVSRNLTSTQSVRCSFCLNLLSHLAETLTFLLLGMSVFSQRGGWHYRSLHLDFILAAFLVTTVSRVLMVYPLLFAVNKGRYIMRICGLFACVRGSASGAGRKGRGECGEEGEVQMADLSISGKDDEDTRDTKDVKDDKLPATDTLTRGSAVKDKENQAMSPGGVAAAVLGGTYASAGAGNRDIPAKSMHMIVLSGCRGAVSFALATIFSDDLGHRALVLSTTTMVILLTLFTQVSLSYNVGILCNVECCIRLDSSDVLQSYTTSSSTSIAYNHILILPSFILETYTQGLAIEPALKLLDIKMGAQAKHMLDEIDVTSPRSGSGSGFGGDNDKNKGVGIGFGSRPDWEERMLAPLVLRQYEQVCTYDDDNESNNESDNPSSEPTAHTTSGLTITGMTGMTGMTGATNTTNSQFSPFHSQYSHYSQSGDSHSHSHSPGAISLSALSAFSASDSLEFNTPVGQLDPDDRDRDRDRDRDCRYNSNRESRDRDIRASRNSRDSWGLGQCTGVGVGMGVGVGVGRTHEEWQAHGDEAEQLIRNFYDSGRGAGSSIVHSEFTIFD